MQLTNKLPKGLFTYPWPLTLLDWFHFQQAIHDVISLKFACWCTQAASLWHIIAENPPIPGVWHTLAWGRWVMSWICWTAFIFSKPCYMYVWHIIEVLRETLAACGIPWHEGCGYCLNVCLVRQTSVWHIIEGNPPILGVWHTLAWGRRWV